MKALDFRPRNPDHQFLDVVYDLIVRNEVDEDDHDVVSDACYLVDYDSLCIKFKVKGHNFKLQLQEDEK